MNSIRRRRSLISSREKDAVLVLIESILSLTTAKFWNYTINVHEKSKNDLTLYIHSCLEIFEHM